MNKKILSLVIAISVLLGAVSISSASTIQAADQRANRLLRDGIISGYSDGTLGLEKSITRAEFSSMLAKLIVDSEDEIDKYKDYSHFSDIDKDNWATSSINMLIDRGIVKGYTDGTYRPKNEITFNEIVVMVVRSMGIEVEAGESWFDGDVKKAKELGILENVKAKDYSKSASRQDVVDIIYNILELNK